MRSYKDVLLAFMWAGLSLTGLAARAQTKAAAKIDTTINGKHISISRDLLPAKQALTVDMPNGSKLMVPMDLQPDGYTLEKPRKDGVLHFWNGNDAIDISFKDDANNTLTRNEINQIRYTKADERSSMTVSYKANGSGLTPVAANIVRAGAVPPLEKLDPVKADATIQEQFVSKTPTQKNKKDIKPF